MRLKHIAVLLIAALAAALTASAQNTVRDFKPAADSLSVLVKEHTGVWTKLILKSVLKRGSELDFYFDKNLGDIPWKEGDIDWLRSRLRDLKPEGYGRYRIGNIYCDGIKAATLVTPSLGNSGKPDDSKWNTEDRGRSERPLVERVGALDFSKGLSSRYISLWQSHGRYYETKTHRWEWQRAQCQQTVEDCYTQSYVLPFLIPMLRNAGAYVIDPRETDTQTDEIVMDNDPAFPEPRLNGVRRLGSYSEEGRWKDAGTGFADLKAVYSGNDNPFTMGTARMAEVSSRDTCRVNWIPDFPKRGTYAVYISYKSLPNSSDAAHYVVKHLGGTSEFFVNQKMGGGTWIYLGTFDFDDGCYVSLDNIERKGHREGRKAVVTADAVRLGGGMGKIARGDKDQDSAEYTTSGLPAYLEGAIYNMQWSGVDSTILNRWDDDYTRDYACRGAWTAMMAGGSRVNPKEKGKGIPVDLSFAFHTDAGTTPNDSIIGTLAIYTSKCDGSYLLPNGEDRRQDREYADFVQSQVVSDIRAKFNPDWTRRQLWDRSYSESRTTGVPAMLLELLSHQNFGDMKYGLDPDFRFTVSRAVYKGILKFLSNRYGKSYAVQPLPVHSFAVEIKDGKTAVLSWKDTEDEIEPTAVPTGYLVYTRVGDGAFDEGRILTKTSRVNGRVYADIPVEKGKLYSFRIAAFNEGGLSFPSETLCLGIQEKSGADKVLVVNDFYRVAPPSWFDTPTYAGFDMRLDSGVPYMYGIDYIGEQYEYRRGLPWLDDDNPGFGASFSNMAGKKIPGNTFDFAYVHAKQIFGLGAEVWSASEDAFSTEDHVREGAWAADIVCGKQVTTPSSDSIPTRYQVFPDRFQKALRAFAKDGGNILVSGSNIGTDIWDEVYPVTKDSAYTARSKAFVSEVLGYKWLTNYASREGRVWVMKSPHIETLGIKEPFSYNNILGGKTYCVETPDGLLPAGPGGATFLRYTDTNISAGVCWSGDGYKAVSLGFPIETVMDEDAARGLFETAFGFFKAKQPIQ